MSMYRQLWLAIVASMLLALGGSLLASLLSARGYLESQLAIKNTDNATALALSLSQGNPDAVIADLVVASLFDSGHYELIRITDPAGKPISERVSEAKEAGAPAWFIHLLPIAASPGQAQITSGWKQFGTVTLVSHSRFAYGALWKSAYEMVLALCVAGVVGGLLGSMVLGRIRKPLNTVIEQARAITQRRFVTVDEPKVPELKQLAIAMNATVGRLKSMFEEEASRLEVVRQEANFDPLTGLANRSHFMARLRQCIDAEDSVGGGLVLVRLANLAEINRRLGRQATDDFLKAAGNAIAACARSVPNGVGARLNGADFAVLLPGDRAGIALARQLLAQLVQVAAPFVDGQSSAWLGVGQFDQGEDMGGLLARVDLALASVEAGHADGVLEALRDTTDEMPRTADQWSVMILRALEHGWVRLISFPVVNAEGGLSHRECPLRLMFDEKGEWLPAGRFLPVAERLKLTPALDLAAVQLGLKELRAQPQLNGLAINLSASSMQDSQFGARLMSLIDTHKDVARRLWLEVSEAGALQHLPAFKVLCNQLKSRGCRTGLEHYGHHFSQIGLLHELGLDYLKVDASFVRGVDANAGNAAFLKGLCSIAHNIGLQVLAEGVATSAELTALVGLGFDGATGPGVQSSVVD
ncbi:EAL domain-containing protein [Rhodoferax sp.]|uniref:bifunctional diguanylate cyclase/phosphodiesterase n=1 Tax=Rhodoferax sp. TaxID=50421 RepID=UPI002ACE954C|nr:EAL domain-containing protein [Rhodoferax sp.]MDZ7920882.1 LapD/MoxY N-terminal periplasmic domain-containing protein [Rhodoferax sp.]